MSNKIKFSHIFIILLYFFVFFWLLKNSFDYLDPDLGWHLKVGEGVSQTHQLPSVNTYNYTFTGKWVDHEWLINYLTYLAWNHIGYLALTTIFAGLIVLVLVLMYKNSRKACPDSSIFLITFIQVFGLIAASPHFGVRMQEIGLLFLFLLLWLIDSYSLKKDWRLLFALPVLLYCWSLLHASFLIGFFVLALWLIVKIAERIIFNLWPNPRLDFSNKLSSRQIGLFSLAALVSVIVTTVTPYGLKLFSFLNGYQDNYYQSHIQEWLSQFVFPFQYWQLGYLAFVALAIIFYVYYSFAKDKIFKIDLWKLILVVCFFVLSFKSRRHFPLLFVASFAFLVESYSTLFKVQIPKKVRTINRGIGLCLIVCLMLFICLLFSETKFTNTPFQSYCSNYPCGAKEFLRQHNEYQSANLFNDYSWGGYLIWQLPERKLFIDGRLPQVPFAGHTYLEEYYDFYKDGKAAQKLDQYDIKLVLIRAKDEDIKASGWEKIFFGITNEELQTKNYLREYLSTSRDWQVIYSDQTSVIYYKIN